MSDLPRVTIYSDGGASPNPGPGGWGALLIAEDGHRKELSGAEPDTTNNRMELTAAVQALRALSNPSEIVFYTDSEYVKKGISEWLPGWVLKGWQRKGGEVKNQDLWQELHRETLRHKIIWKWVKAHAGNVNNERVDHLATAARNKMLGRSTPAPTPSAAPAPSAPVDAEIGLRVLGDPSRKKGGWAIRILRSGTPETHTGRDSSATTPRLLLLAALDALRRLPDGGKARVYCPDEYLFKGMTAWVKGWRAKGWVTSSGSPVKHQELWEQLLDEAKRVQIEWVLEGNYQQLPLINGLDQAAQKVVEG